MVKHEVIPAFTQEWWIVNFITVTTIILLLFYTKQLKNSSLTKFTYFVGIFLCSRVVFMQFYQLYMDVWVAASSIPLHLCGLSSILAGLLMFKRNQLAYECLFYWGLAGALHSLLTPEFTLGKLDSIIYADYFISHGGIIFAALYLTIILKMRPSEYSWLKIFIFSQILIPIVGTINWLLDSNYLYLCAKPIVDNPLIIGDWPWYIVFIEIFALIHCWLLYQPIKLFKNK